ncbi:MAG: hypothetical protein MRJ96_11575 [Nitrospirales bacterium]|nr:hypothetical protein [Nitrospira sp.]MDR4502079.1 hypothetical protein [Nitrospirales bacterium]
MSPLIVFALALVLVFVFTPLIRTIAIRQGYVAHPQSDRWHRTPTALLGGIGIFFAFLIPLLFFASEFPALQLLLFGALLISGVGFIDDLLHLKPYSKLLGQIVAACVVIAGGQVLGLFSWSLYSLALALVWIVGVTNAFNLLDNMDGLSAGTGCIAAFCLLLAGLITDNAPLVLGAASLMGAALGFLWFNFPPAKIFMGDSGSLLLGFTLSFLALLGQWENATSVMFALLIPVLVLAVPIFDTAFVSLIRFFNDRPISKGGKDHTSHGLVAFGLSERATVLLFYLMSMICGTLALLGLKYSMLYPSILGILFVIVFWYFGVFLSGFISYGKMAHDMVQATPGLGLKLFLMHKKRVGEVVVDCLLIGLAFTIAFLIRFDGMPSEYIPAIASALPILIPLKLGAFFYFGLYRGLWRYVGMQDIISIIKAVSLSSLLGVVVITMLFRFEGYPRSVFVIDWMVLLLMVSGVRVLIRMFEEYLGTFAEQTGKRLLIVGAGDAGEIALRELKNNPQLGYRPVGFLDDDPQKVGRSIHGLRIFGSRAMLHSIVRDHNVQEILIAIPSADHHTFMRVYRDCKNSGVTVKVMPKTVTLMEPLLAQ